MSAPIHRYGLVLRPVTGADLERVRRWRNAPHVRREMDFREHITPVMQAAWWRGLDPFRNYYWMIEVKGVAVGVVHAKEIDWDAGVAEAGIFIGKREYLNGFVPVLAVLGMMDAVFEEMGLKMLKAKVKAGQQMILDFNRRLGYEVVGEEGGFLRLEVSGERYLEVARPLRVMAARVGSEG